MLLTSKKISILLLTIWLGLLMSSCASQEPIKVGFAGELTGSRAELGVGARNGAILAVEAINAEGGINGRRLELLIEDDQGEPETARRVDEKLVNEGVVAIIGHITSGQTAAVLDQINQAETVLLSPVSTSAQFSDQRDYFFRVATATDAQGIAMANYAYQTMKLRQVTVIYDASNEPFTAPLWQAFATKFEALGGEIIEAFSFVSRETDLNAFTDELLDSNPSALVFFSAAIDTALMLQYINQQEGDKPKLFSSSWAQTKEFLAKGGQAIEGLHLNAMYTPDNPNPDFQDFFRQYEEYFGRQPEAAAANGYEAIQVLAEALKRAGGEPEGLPEALITIKELPTIQGSITMNEYGDIKRDVYMMVVEDGQYKLVETVSSN